MGRLRSCIICSRESRGFQMNDYSLYVEMRDRGETPLNAYLEGKKHGLNAVTGLLMLRTVFDLSFIDARRVCYKGDTGLDADR